MENTRENDKRWMETLQERNRVLEELLSLTQLENKELNEQLNINVVVSDFCECEGEKEYHYAGSDKCQWCVKPFKQK
jgi:hypothetical protein